MNEESAKAHLDKTLRDGIRFEIGDYIQEGWNLCKTNFGGYIVYIIILIAISLGAGLVPIIGQLILFLYTSPALIVGGALYTFEHDFNKKIETERMFDGFKMIRKILPAYLIIGLIYLVLLTPLIYYLGGEYYEFLSSNEQQVLIDAWTAAPKIPLMISVFAVIVLNVFIMFVCYFIALYNLNYLDSLKYSFAFVKEKFVFILFFNIILAIISMLGFVAFCVGVIFTMALKLPMTYAAFKDMTKLKEYQTAGSPDSEMEDYW